MKKYTIVVLLLLLQALLDATGDAFRFNGWLVVSHTMEALQIAGWFVFAGLFVLEVAHIPYIGRNSIIRLLLFYVLMYTLGRIWLFDITHNLWCGNDLLYLGESDLVGKTIRWFADLVRQNYTHFSFMVKFLALFSWIALFIKYRRVAE